MMRVTAIPFPASESMLGISRVAWRWKFRTASAEATVPSDSTNHRAPVLVILGKLGNADARVLDTVVRFRGIFVAHKFASIVTPTRRITGVGWGGRGIRVEDSCLARNEKRQCVRVQQNEYFLVSPAADTFARHRGPTKDTKSRIMAKPRQR